MAREPGGILGGYVYHVPNRSGLRIALIRNDPRYDTLERQKMDASTFGYREKGI